MRYRKQDEEALLGDILGFSHDPEGYVEYAYPWGEPGTPLAKYKGPRGWQREILQEIKHHLVTEQLKFDVWDGREETADFNVFQECVASGRGIGKSAGFGMLTNWFLSTHIGATVILTANTETQLKTKTFPEVNRWFTLAINSHWWETATLGVSPKAWIADAVKTQLKIDTGYWGAQGLNWSESNPDAFAGTHNDYGLSVFFDESSGIPEPIWSVTRGFFTELNPFRLWIVFSNPRRNYGAFYDRFHDKAKMDGWIKRQIDGRTVEGTDKSVYRDIIRDYGEHSDEAKKEVYGQFPDQGEGQLVKNSTIQAAADREITYAEVNDDPIILGVDPAPGSGRTVMRFRQGLDAKTFPVTELWGVGNRAIADKCIELISRWNPDAIAVDAGNGHGVISYLEDAGIRVHQVHFGNATLNTNGEFALVSGDMWGAMRDWLERGMIDKHEALMKDLRVRTWQWFGGREDGKKLLTPKREMEKLGIPSPDHADALALTFYPKMPKRSSRTNRGARRGSVRKAKGTQNWQFA